MKKEMTIDEKVNGVLSQFPDYTDKDWLKGFGEGVRFALKAELENKKHTCNYEPKYKTNGVNYVVCTKCGNLKDE